MCLGIAAHRCPSLHLLAQGLQHFCAVAVTLSAVALFCCCIFLIPLTRLSPASGSLEAAKEASRAADPTDVRPHIVLGNLYWATGKASQASKEYQAALRAGPTACPLDLYLRLGTTFLADGEFEYARNVYVQVQFWFWYEDCVCF